MSFDDPRQFTNQMAYQSFFSPPGFSFESPFVYPNNADMNGPGNAQGGPSSMSMPIMPMSMSMDMRHTPGPGMEFSAGNGTGFGIGTGPFSGPFSQDGWLAPGPGQDGDKSK
jgi:hypothetical protein